MHCCIGVRSVVKPSKRQVKHVHESKIHFISLAQVAWSHLEASVDGREAAPENSCVQADWVGSSRQLFIASTSVWRLTRVLITSKIVRAEITTCLFEKEHKLGLIPGN